MRIIQSVIIMSSLAAVAVAEIKSKAVEYKHGDVVLEGYLAWDDSAKEPRPGVIVVHEWWGLTEHMKKMTRDVASMGYVAFAVDMYGKGVTTDKKEEAGKLATPFRDNKLRRKRAKAGYDAFLANADSAGAKLDKSRIGAIGFCFGGTTVLQMAYSGLDLRGVVSFHGALQPPDAGDASVKAKVLVLHGADDPLVPEADVKAFQDGVRKAGIDWQMMYYGGAVHSFTNPGADKVGIPGVKYDAATDQRSRGHMKMFFDEVFKPAK